MARSISEIQKEMLFRKEEAAELSALTVLTTEEQANLNNLTSTSKVAIWRLWVYIIAFCIWTLEVIFDLFRIEISEKVKANRPHTQGWYKIKALAFQYGDALVDSDEYAIIDEAKKIIKQVAILEGDRKVVVKIATLIGSELSPLIDNDQVNAFAAYMNKIKDAGTVIEIINKEADKLRVELDFYYDALIVDNDGKLIDTPTESVVKIAIESYLKSLDFDGEFESNKMVDFIQKSAGYKSLKLNFVGFKAGLSNSFSPITRAYQPLSGYMKIEPSELLINYNAVV